MLWRDTQMLAMAVMFLTGAGLGLALDILAVILGRPELPARGRRRARRARRFSFWDAALWVIVTPLVFLASVISNQGDLRIYVFIGLALGLAAYVFLARGVVVAAGLAVRTAVGSSLVAAGRWWSRRVAGPVREAGRGVGHASRAFARWGQERGRDLGRGLGRAADGVGAALGQAGLAAKTLGRKVWAGFRRRSSK